MFRAGTASIHIRCYSLNITSYGFSIDSPGMHINRAFYMVLMKLEPVCLLTSQIPRLTEKQPTACLDLQHSVPTPAAKELVSAVANFI